MTEKKRIGIWIRVSTEMQVKEESPEHHEQRARMYAEANDWVVVEVYQLDAVSGKAVMHHPEAKRMLNDIRSGHITGLVFSKLARLARSTKELLEFAEIFRSVGADLISLAERIDTSSPAGRLFFTIISAMAEWEREEIASRVAASVPIRARMGKSTGGQATYGYKWENNRLTIDEKEAPVRKLVYELFITHQRKKSTADALNALGYRTRNGSEFSDTTVGRLLRDPTAKGLRIANYTKSGGNKKSWVVKPQSEWITNEVPAIVTPELWDECNRVLDAQYKRRTPVGPKAKHLLSGMVQCHCGKAMYVYHKTYIYSCRSCKNRIAVKDIDEIYQHHLHDYLSSINIQDYLNQSDQQLQQRKQLLDTTLRERNRLTKQVNTLVQLRSEGEINKELFQEQYKPLELQIMQLDQQLPELEAEIDVRTIQRQSSETVLDDAKVLSTKWPTLPFEQKRAIVETITEQVEIGKDEIDITFAYNPTRSLNGGKSPPISTGSYSQPALMNMDSQLITSPAI